jgi:hypothetical protein
VLSQAGQDREIKAFKIRPEIPGRLGPGLWSKSESSDPPDLSLMPLKERVVLGMRGDKQGPSG